MTYAERQQLYDQKRQDSIKRSQEYAQKRKEKADAFRAQTGMTMNDYYALKRKESQIYKPAPEGTYYVDIPGIKDVFKYTPKSWEDKNLKRQRYERFKTKKSPVPGWLNWIPNIINYIDDGQDLLYTGLWLFRPLLRKIATRFIPYVGWAMLAMDLANLINQILGLAMTPGISKPCVRKTYHQSKRLKKASIKAFRSFIAPAGWRRWMGFVLQAPQATQSLTGYGLVLGSIMGTISDTIWSIPRFLTGNKIVFRGPPPSDPIQKAQRFLVEGIYDHNIRDVLEPEEHAMLLMAKNIAIGILLESNIPIIWDRTNIIQDFPTIVSEPWHPVTLDVLQENNVDLMEEIDAFSPLIEPTVDDTVFEAIAEYPNWESTAREWVTTENYEFWSVIYQIYTEASNSMIANITGLPEESFLEEHDYVKAAARLAELDLMPLAEPTTDQLTEIWEIARIKAMARNSYFPTEEEWKEAIEEVCKYAVSKIKPPGTIGI